MKCKTILLCGGLGELARGIWEKYPENTYILIDLAQEPENLKKILSNYVYIQADITDGKKLKENIDSTLRNKSTKIDAMMNTPRTIFQANFQEASYEEIKKAIDTKLIGYANLIKSALPYFAPHCSIVNIGSVHGQRTKAGNSAYAAANAGVEALTRALAIEFRHQFRINTLSPGGFLTESYKKTNIDWKSKVEKEQILKIEDIINIVLFLFSEKSKGINGANIIADGGVSALRANSNDW